MNDNERKDVHELTNVELVREIAEARGWRVVKGQKWFKVVAPGHTEFESGGPNNAWWSEEIAWQSPAIPNWPQDGGAAFRLVRDVLDRLNDTDEFIDEEGEIDGRSWALTVTDNGAYFIKRTNGGQNFQRIGGTEIGYRDARALSELATQALRQMGGAR